MKIRLIYAVFATMFVLFATLETPVNGQDRKITGTVYKDGKVAAGATVTGHKTTASFFTSFDGKYELILKEKSKFIRVELAGEEKKVELKGSDVVDVYFGEATANNPKTNNTEADPDNSGDDENNFGSNPDECKKNLSIYREYIKLGNYKDAYPAWKKAHDGCPASTKNIYIDGIKMYKDYIEKEPEKTDEYVEEMMKIYDERITYFKQKGFVLGRKGVDLLRYKRDDEDKLREGYGYLTGSIKISQTKAEAAVIITQMQASCQLFKLGVIPGTEVVTSFSTASNILQKQLQNAKSEKTKKKAENAIVSIEKIFAECGAASCEDLIKIYTPQFDANPDNFELLKNINDMLDRTKCEDSNLYLNTLLKIYAKEPSAEMAYRLAKLYFKRENNEKSVEFFNEAISKTKNNDDKAQYYYEMAVVLSKVKRYSEARSNALKAAEIKPNWGMPYMLIGFLYVGSSQMCNNSNNLDGKAVFWIGVDMFRKAKNVDPSVSNDADTQISKYSQYFPDNETVFFHGYTDGDSYSIGCWIGGKTIVRTIKK